MSKFVVTVEGKKYEVEVYEKEENVFIVKIKDREYIVYLPREILEEIEFATEEVSTRLSRAIEDSITRLQIQPPQVIEELGPRIVSEIPGRIVKIMIKEGDTIEKGQTVVALESMKMVIEVKSPYRGKVKKIFVKEGSFIDVGQLIAILEPI
jgi:biotin carboxyl carrier protein